MCVKNSGFETGTVTFQNIALIRVQVLVQFAIIVWEAALPPCVCAFVAMITYISLSRTSQWNLMFQVVLGQLYVISFFITL